jgi:hypothetical protein
MAVIIIILLIVSFAGFIVLYIHQREEIFEGEVVDKDIVETTPAQSMNNRPGLSFGSAGYGGVQHTYKVKVKTSNGQTKNWTVSEGKYEIIKIGDRVSKSKGTRDLEIISSAPSAPAPAMPPTDMPNQPPAGIAN